MLETNLLFRPKEGAKEGSSQTQEHLDEHFSIEIKKETIELLQTSEDDREIQEILNIIFTEDRRKAMTGKSSKDKHGRPVKYYRYISWDRLVDLLKQGKHDTLYPDKILDKADEERLKSFVLDCLSINYKSLDSSKITELREKDLGDVLIFAFPQVKKKEIESLLANFTRANVKKFIDAYLENKDKKRAHSGSYYMDFANYLSVSVGGVIQSNLNQNNHERPKVYLEMVIPDEQIILNPKSHIGEKEVFVRGVKISNITRICLDEDLRTKLLLGHDSNILAHATSQEVIDSKKIDDKDYWPDIVGAVESWRWSTSINDYLPESLSSRKASR